MFINIKKQSKNSRAFTLIEALVAISILMIAIASPMTLAQKGLSTATLSKDQMIASFLVQDAIELVKNIRDKRAVSATSGDWLADSDLQKCICTGSECDFAIPISTTLKFCKIDTDGTVQPSLDVNDAKLKITYNVKSDGTKQFLKYDYNLLSSCGSTPGVGPCSETSKFSRYINIKKTSNPDEAIVNARVQWDSPQGVQVIDVQDFIYNYSENL